MKMVKICALIVDDDVVSCNVLHKMISDFSPIIKVLGVANSCETAIHLINTHKPDVVFLDIEMADGNAFTLLESVDYRSFDVIFITSYEKYAITAFKFSAVDYLLKPVKLDDLQIAIAKLISPQGKNNQIIKQDALIHNLKNPNNNPNKIIIPTSDKYLIVSPDEIIRCQADNYYTRIFFTDGTSTIVSKTLKEYVSLLEEVGFIRVHNSHLINTKWIRSFIKTDGGFLIMSDNTEIPFSRRRKSSVITSLSQMFSGI